MSEEELIEFIQDQTETVEHLEALVHTSIEKRKDLEATVDNLADRVDELEAENERLRDRLDETTPEDRDDRLASLVEYAHNQRGGVARDRDDSVIKVSPKEMAGATGYSKRHCYDLVEDWSDEYTWLLSPDQLQQYGDLERDMQQDGTYLAVDFEGVHSPGVPLNRFNNVLGGEDQ
jgi:regulator of replication initiation timing